MDHTRSRREEYVRPSITRLEYVADVKVSMQNTCKNPGVGPGTGGDCTVNQQGDVCGSSQS
jgi:hypothetical protein